MGSFVIASEAWLFHSCPPPLRDCFVAYAPRNDKRGVLLRAEAHLGRTKAWQSHLRDCFGAKAPRNDRKGEAPRNDNGKVPLAMTGRGKPLSHSLPPPENNREARRGVSPFGNYNSPSPRTRRVASGDLIRGRG